jgi:hypothetical protein
MPGPTDVRQILERLPVVQDFQVRVPLQSITSLCRMWL